MVMFYIALRFLKHQTNLKSIIIKGHRKKKMNHIAQT